MKTLHTFILCALLLDGCATTVPTVEEGWVPLDEWNRRIVHAPTHRTNAAVAEQLQNPWTSAQAYTPSKSVRTYCHSYRRYTRCSSY